MRFYPWRWAGYFAVFGGALLMRLRGVKKASPEAYVFRRQWNKAIAAAFRFKFKIQGPLPGPGTLIVANHNGFADIIGLASSVPADARATYISKKEVLSVPLFGWVLRTCHDVPLDRSDKDARKRAITEALERLRAGYSVIVFPEGTRSKDGKPKTEIRPGLIEAARAAGFPIHPVAIFGTAGLELPLVLLRAKLNLHMQYGQARRDFADANAVWNEVLRLWNQLASNNAQAPAKSQLS